MVQNGWHKVLHAAVGGMVDVSAAPSAGIPGQRSNEQLRPRAYRCDDWESVVDYLFGDLHWGEHDLTLHVIDAV